jgi:hypothetical protein
MLGVPIYVHAVYVGLIIIAFYAGFFMCSVTGNAPSPADEDDVSQESGV